MSRIRAEDTSPEIAVRSDRTDSSHSKSAARTPRRCGHKWTDSLASIAAGTCRGSGLRIPRRRSRSAQIGQIAHIVKALLERPGAADTSGQTLSRASQLEHVEDPG